MGCETIVEFDRLNLKANTMLVFFYLEARSRCQEDGRIQIGREALGDRLDLSEKVVRGALKELQEMGLISVAGQRGRREAMMISFPQRKAESHRAEGQQKGQQKGQQETLKIQHETNYEGQQKGQQKGHTGVQAVSRSSAVALDVSSGVLEKDLGQQPRARGPVVDKSPTAPPRRRRQEDYDAAIARAPRLPDVYLQIDRLYADMSGHKYPWSQHPYAAGILADLICSHGEALVIAAAEKFFQRGEPWIERRGWAIEEFGRLFAGLIANDSVKRRLPAILRDMQTSGRPTTPKELRAQLDAMRRRQLDEISEKREKELSVV